MDNWKKTTFFELLLDSLDGEWGISEKSVGYTLCEVIRGTDFSSLGSPSLVLPQRWIKDHIVKRKQLQAGDLILETAGGTAKQSTGRSAILRDSFFKIHPEKPILCASFSRHLRLKKDYIPEFIFYLLQALYNAGFMAVYNIQHTGVSRFQYTTFKNKAVLKIPPIETQRKIAGVLSAYDDLIENNKRRIALLEKMAEEIYREWFVRMRFPGHESTKFEKGLPVGWESVKIEKAFQFTGGGTPSKAVLSYWIDGNINWYTPSDITSKDGIFLFESKDKCTEEGLNKSSAKIFPEYSIMLTSRATIGAIGINTTPACTNQGFITCFPNKQYPLTYLYHWLKLGKFNFELLATGATFLELTKGTFKRIEILSPSLEIVTQFEAVTRPIFDQIELLIKANKNLKKTRDRLLPRLISGKLSVENLDIQNPPSMQ